MIEHLAVAIVSAIAFLGAILLYGAFSPRRLEGWKFWLCFAAHCVLMEGNGFLANELFSVCGAVGDGVGRQTLYNVIRYALLYALLFRERPVIYLSVTVIFYSWACCIENLVVGAILIFQDDAIRLAVEYHERGWLIWINELLILCGCAIISKAHPYQPQSHAKTLGCVCRHLQHGVFCAAAGIWRPFCVCLCRCPMCAFCTDGAWNNRDSMMGGTP